MTALIGRAAACLSRASAQLEPGGLGSAIARCRICAERAEAGWPIQSTNPHPARPPVTRWGARGEGGGGGHGHRPRSSATVIGHGQSATVTDTDPVFSAGLLVAHGAQRRLVNTVSDGRQE